MGGNNFRRTRPAPGAIPGIASGIEADRLDLNKRTITITVDILSGKTSMNLDKPMPILSMIELYNRLSLDLLGQLAEQQRAAGPGPGIFDANDKGGQG